jgi:hypothetical protein
MNRIQKNTARHMPLKKIQTSVPVRLATLWASLMMLSIYVDYFHLYMPGSLQSMLAGKVYVFDISYTFLMVAMSLVAVAAVMMFLAVTLPPAANRWTNIIVASFYIPYMLFNLVGEAWPHMYLAAAVEVILLCCIIRYAWRWPRANTGT